MEEWKNASASGDLPELEAVLYVGTAGGLESRIVTRAGVDFRAVQAGALRGLSPWRALVNTWVLLKGTVQAWRIQRDFRPDVLLATGGYASAPVVMAATGWLSGFDLSTRHIAWIGSSLSLALGKAGRGIL